MNLRAVATTWLAMMLAETANGIFREAWLEARIGRGHAQLLSFVFACVILAGVARWRFPTLKIQRWPQALLAGALWSGFTGVFELGLGRILGKSWSDILREYDLTQGGLMGLGLLYLTVLPVLIALIYDPESNHPTPPTRQR
jgi:hypothetical protein